ncbi:hypothetical protein [Nonomuraea sp. NPDC046570]|uniref:relaxase/mobilization nuclease domain-containing protein n=1 Tax=Nonomuraea sp. NPDC046570 TaxID=3155255 RepID=UPI0033FB9D9C
MIGKVMRGARVEGLIYYLYGPGRANEHVDPHLVAGWRHPAELEPELRPDGSRDFRRLNGLLKQPVAALGERGYAEPVWHCVARAAEQDRILDDDEWAQVAHEIMHRTGLAAHEDDEAVRWVAVRHASDHIHIVATLARQDGVKPKTWNDFFRVREACQAVEHRFGLRLTAPGDRTAARRPTRAENEHARRRRWTEAPRIALRRQVISAAGGAASEVEFFGRLKAAGVLVRKRFGERNPGEVTGYAVALPIHTTRDGGPVWYGGGKLAADLTLPKLRARWSNQNDTGLRISDVSAKVMARTAVRQAAKDVGSQEEFFARLKDAGLLVRWRLSEREPGEVTGYAVALPGFRDRNGGMRWFAGGRLADDLTLPKLRARWAGDRQPVEKISAAERQAIFDDAAAIAQRAAAQIRRSAAGDPAAGDAAWAASDVLHVAASMLDDPALRRAADAFDRAAREPYARIPCASPAGQSLRVAARLMAATGAMPGSASGTISTLVRNLGLVVAAVAELREFQQRTAHAVGARAAARHLQTARGGAGRGVSAQARLAELDFPGGPAARTMGVRPSEGRTRRGPEHPVARKGPRR